MQLIAYIPLTNIIISLLEEFLATEEIGIILFEINHRLMLKNRDYFLEKVHDFKVHQTMMGALCLHGMHKLYSIRSRTYFIIF